MSPVVVNTVCKVWASCGTVVIRRLLRRYRVVHILIVPKEPSYMFVTLMRKGDEAIAPPPPPAAWSYALGVPVVLGAVVPGGGPKAPPGPPNPKRPPPGPPNPKCPPP